MKKRLNQLSKKEVINIAAALLDYLIETSPELAERGVLEESLFMSASRLEQAAERRFLVLALEDGDLKLARQWKTLQAANQSQ